ncbi:MAG: hypothetical protein GY862_00090 [Gammaproteobacteria bacterium]|nr:hypothetical protein [Gammaproteobacteria bacterium]
MNWILLLALMLMPHEAVMGASSAKKSQQRDEAVAELLEKAKDRFQKGQNERAAALLERALRIAPRSAVLWHNLAGVRLQQEEWDRAASLAKKSITLAVKDRLLRIRNYTVISLACQGMKNMPCARDARERAIALAKRRR